SSQIIYNDKKRHNNREPRILVVLRRGEVAIHEFLRPQFQACHVDGLFRDNSAPFDHDLLQERNPAEVGDSSLSEPDPTCRELLETPELCQGVHKRVSEDVGRISVVHWHGLSLLILIAQVPRGDSAFPDKRSDVLGGPELQAVQCKLNVFERRESEEGSHTVERVEHEVAEKKGPGCSSKPAVGGTNVHEGVLRKKLEYCAPQLVGYSFERRHGGRA
ncbi:hypothetical protein FB45DRAFT_1116357, partial [Roridomyces roridus]